MRKILAAAILSGLCCGCSDVNPWAAYVPKGMTCERAKEIVQRDFFMKPFDEPTFTRDWHMREGACFQAGNGGVTSGLPILGGARDGWGHGFGHR